MSWTLVAMAFVHVQPMQLLDRCNSGGSFEYIRLTEGFTRAHLLVVRRSINGPFLVIKRVRFGFSLMSSERTCTVNPFVGVVFIALEWLSPGSDIAMQSWRRRRRERSGRHLG
jgi:hypothetical protein